MDNHHQEGSPVSDEGNSNAGKRKTDIAIIGMASLFAKSGSLRDYWQNILDKVDAVREEPEEWQRWFFDPEADSNDRLYNNKVGFLAELATFNPMDFGIMPNAIGGGEPDHFLALRLSKEALEDAGYWDKDFDRTKVGLAFGHGTYVNRSFSTLFQHGLVVDQTMDLLRKLMPELDEETFKDVRTKLKESLPEFNADVVPSLVPNVLSGRVANRLDLMGPNYLVDSACSSALIALEQAVRELLSGRSDMMLVAGVHGTAPPQIHMMFQQINALSHTVIRPFDEEGDGMLFGEGVGVVVLKRLADAERDGDRIYAVIKGIASSSDGRALGLLAPRYEGQLLALNRAYHDCQIDTETIELIEAHGTGIPLGDKTEIGTLTTIFGERKKKLPHRAIGSVKGNIGHTITAAGMAGLIKAALAVYHRVLPPTLCDKVHPDLGIENSTFYVNSEARPWIHGNPDVPRRAGVNAFGFGGTNAHVVLEEYPHTRDDEKQLHHHWPQELFVFSGNSRDELDKRVRKIITFIESENSCCFADLAYTLADPSEFQGQYRLAVIASGPEDLKEKLETALDKAGDPRRAVLLARKGIYFADKPGSGKTAFLFTGQGSQYPNMLADLCIHFPLVRRWFDFLDETFIERDLLPSQVLFAPPLGLSEEEKKLIEDEFFKIDFGNDIVSVADMALYDLLGHLGVKADVMVGHSDGEFSALVASGAIRSTGKDYLKAAIQRLTKMYHEFLENQSVPTGVLLGVGNIEPDVLRRIVDSYDGRIHLALDNCPHQVVLFGDPADVDNLIPRLEKANGIWNKMPFDLAYHTPLFESVVSILKPFYDSLDIGPGQVPLYSCVNGEKYPDDPDGIRAQAVATWTKRVRFRETILNLYEKEGVRTFVEVGPSGNLTAFVQDTLADRDYLAVSSNNQRRGGLEQLQHLVAQLFVIDSGVRPENLFSFRELEKIPLDPEEIAAKKKKRRVQVLDLNMPEMSLDDKTAENVRRKLTAKIGGSVSPAPGVSQAAQEPQSSGNVPAAPRPATAAGVSERPGELPPHPLSHYQPPQPATRPVQSFGAAPSQPHPAQSAGGNGGASAAQPVAGAGFPPPAPLAGPTDPRTAILQNHFDLMKQFLASQARIMAGTEIETPTLTPPPAAAPAPVAQPVAEPDGEPLSFEELWPFLGEIKEQSAEKLVCKRHYDIEKDVFVQHHTMGDYPSSRQPDLLPIAVVPLVISMEASSEAAVYLLGGDKVVTSLYNLRGHRWIALDRGELDLEIVARLLPRKDDQSWDVHVQIFQMPDPAVGNKRILAFDAFVKVADRYPDPPQPFAYRLENPYPSHYPDDKLYNMGVPNNPKYPGEFHGPRFRGVTHVRGWTRDVVEGDLVKKPHDDFFTHIKRPVFRIDPVLIDTTAQLNAFWAADAFGVGVNHLPFFTGKINFYAPPYPAGTPLLGRLKCGFMNMMPGGKETRIAYEWVDREERVIASVDVDKQVNFEAPDEYYRCRLSPRYCFMVFEKGEVLDPNGRVIVQIEDWQNNYFSIPKNYDDVGLYPQIAYLSEPWKQDETGVICRRILPFPEGFLEESWGMYMRKLAHLTLNNNEQDFWYNLPIKGTRRAEWLLGRIAAKDAIRQWADQEHNIKLAPADIEIRSTDAGKPYAYVSAFPELALPDISISRSGEYVVAVAGKLGERIGVDMERLAGVKTDDLLKGGFSADEAAMFGALDDETRTKTVLGLWCAKEAAAKAAATGLEYNPTLWNVGMFSLDNGIVNITHENRSFECRLYITTEEILAVCRIAERDGAIEPEDRPKDEKKEDAQPVSPAPDQAIKQADTGKTGADATSGKPPAPQAKKSEAESSENGTVSGENDVVMVRNVGETVEAAAPVEETVKRETPPIADIADTDEAGKTEETVSAEKPSATQAPASGPEEKKQYSPEEQKPRNDLDRQLLEIWEEILGVEDIGIHDNFFDLGGQSVLAVKLMGRVQELTGRNLPLATFFEAQTVAKMSDILSEEGWTESWSSLVPLQTGGTKRPLYLVHPVGGNVLRYRDLASLMGDDQPVYGLQAVGLDGTSEPLGTIEEMAEHYIREMRQAQPQGPYSIGGFSAGGIIAFEMARQLLEVGEKTAPLVLFDTYGPGFEHPEGIIQVPAGIRTFFWRIGLHLENMALLPAKDRVGYVTQRLVRGRWRQRKKFPDALRRVQSTTRAAMNNYEPKPYDGKMALFRAGQNRHVKKNPYLGWDGFVRGGITTYDVPGSHGHFVEQPHVKVTAKELIRCIEDAEKEYRNELKS